MKSPSVALILCLIMSASPLMAQETTPASTLDASASAPAPSAERLKAAATVVDKLWPVGTYRKMMGGEMEDMIGSMFDEQAEDMAANMTDSMASLEPGGSRSGKPRIPVAQGPNFAEIMEQSDPHARERARISKKVMLEEMGPVLDKIEPSIRASLTTIYARDYTVAQLADLDRFLSTPTGQKYAQTWVGNFYDPEMTKALQKSVPEMGKAMPEIMKKVAAATAHLVPPPVDANKDDPASQIVTDEDRSANWSAADKKAIAQQQAAVEGAEQGLGDQIGMLSLLRMEAHVRAGGKLSADDQEYLDSLREIYGKGKK